MSEENEIKSNPLGLVIIPIFYGLCVFLSVLGAGEQYIFFSLILPRNISVVLVVIETGVLLFLTIGIFRRQAVARKVLIGYNIYAITDILFTLTFIKKQKLLTLVESASDLEGFASINLFFCLIMFLILRYVRVHKEYFTN